jgi:hypothetical protein
MELTTLAGLSHLHDRGTSVGGIVELDDSRFAAVIRHPVTQEELVIGVWPTCKVACAGMWRIHSLPRDQKLSYLHGSSAS